MSTAPSLTDKTALPVPVETRPHWRVRFRPETFEPQRFPSLQSCWAAVQASSVRLRGWDYPHLDPYPASQEHGQNWVASWVNWDSHIEYWRLFQSGQFLHLFAFREDLDKGKADSRLRQQLTGVPEGFTPSGYLDVTGLMLKLTEIFEFAKRLALKGALGEAFNVEVALQDVEDRVLWAFEPRRDWHSLYRSTQPDLRQEWFINRLDIVTDAATPALAAAEWFYERFGWLDAPMDLIAREQREFVEGAGKWGLVRD